VDVYILDSLYRRSQLVDKFKSLVWAERYRDIGDFELHLYSTLQNRTRFKPGTLLGLLESNYVMTVETVEDSVSDEGEQILKVTGSSLEAILKSRIAIPSHGATTNWVITDVPVAVAKKVFHDICVTGSLNAKDIIPSVVEGSFLPTDNIAEPADSITWTIEPTTVYDTTKSLCDIYDLGFRLILNKTNYQLYYDIYPGSDRTSQQSTLPAVVFSPELDNLQNVTELSSTANYRTTAMVTSPSGSLLVNPVGFNPALVSGFTWKTILVNASDIDEPWSTAEAKLQKRGRDELAKYGEIWSFDGEIAQFSKYKYNQDYYLGDLVTMQTKDGLSNDMRVTEQIFVSDSTGDKTYPTLSLSKFITPGSWSAWDYTQDWEDMGSTEYWNTQP
jgi:hypothetical protein